QLTAASLVVPYVHSPSQRIPVGWSFDICFEPQVDIIVAARLDTENENIESYYILPKLAGFSGQFWVGRGTELVILEAYRSRNLVPLLESIVTYDVAEAGS
ncbi:MAG: hypothetical protein ACRD4F_17945, partial [Candidatus Angelobacter sp.]